MYVLRTSHIVRNYVHKYLMALKLPDNESSIAMVTPIKMKTKIVVSVPSIHNKQYQHRLLFINNSYDEPRLLLLAGLIRNIRGNAWLIVILINIYKYIYIYCTISLRYPILYWQSMFKHRPINNWIDYFAARLEKKFSQPTKQKCCHHLLLFSLNVGSNA